MRRGLAAVAGLAVAASVLGLNPARSTGPASIGAPPTAAVPNGVITPDVPIKHVVIIYQENHSFDDVLGLYCEQTAETRAEPCDGYAGPVTMDDGIVATNPLQPDVVPASEHSPRAQKYAMHGKWDDIDGCQNPPYWCVSHVDPANIPNLVDYANRFTVSDRTFAAGHNSSFVAHVTLGGGTDGGFIGANPVRSQTGVEPKEGWGCPSRRDAVWGPDGDRSYQPSCIPDQQGRGPYRESLVPYAPTIMERMEQADLSWHIYEGDDNDKPLVGPWSICTYFYWCLNHRFNTKHDSKRPDFLEDAANGTLPRLSFLLPTGSTPIGGISQHNGNSMRLGDNYIGKYVAAAMNGPEWKSTVIFITYDDCGCFYDHVDPPRRNMGLRNPMVIVSPWSRPGGTDSTDAIQPYSMLAFAEHLFDLRPLNDEVSAAYDYADAFDFQQQPIMDVPPPVTQSISAQEQRRLAILAPSVEEDPT